MNREELLHALKIVIPGVSKGESLLTGTDSFIFRNGLIQTYNEHLSVTFPLDIGIEGAVKAAEMARVLEKMQGLEITIELRGKAIFVTDGFTELSMQLLDTAVSTHLTSLALEDLDWDELPPDFMKALSLCLPSVSRNPAHDAMMGIRFEGEDVLACDNMRCSWCVVDASLPDFTLPGGAANELKKIPDLTGFSVSGSWVHFQNKDGVVFSSRLFAAEFPSAALRNYFNFDGELIKYQFPAGLEKALERAEIMSFSQENGSPFVTLEEKKGKLVIRGERQYGTLSERIPLETDWPKGVSLDIDPRHLLHILSLTREFQVSGRNVYFQTEGHKHVISTIIPKDED